MCFFCTCTGVQTSQCRRVAHSTQHYHRSREMHGARLFSFVFFLGHGVICTNCPGRSDLVGRCCAHPAAVLQQVHGRSYRRVDGCLIVVLSKRCVVLSSCRGRKKRGARK